MAVLKHALNDSIMYQDVGMHDRLSAGTLERKAQNIFESVPNVYQKQVDDLQEV